MFPFPFHSFGGGASVRGQVAHDNLDSKDILSPQEVPNTIHIEIHFSLEHVAYSQNEVFFCTEFLSYRSL